MKKGGNNILIILFIIVILLIGVYIYRMNRVKESFENTCVQSCPITGSKKVGDNSGLNSSCTNKQLGDICTNCGSPEKGGIQTWRCVKADDPRVNYPSKGNIWTYIEEDHMS